LFLFLFTGSTTDGQQIHEITRNADILYTSTQDTDNPSKQPTTQPHDVILPTPIIHKQLTTNSPQMTIPTANHMKTSLSQQMPITETTRKPSNTVPPMVVENKKNGKYL